MPQQNLFQILESRKVKALIFDLDGVITQTAKLHASAWKSMFDAYLQQRGEKEGKTYPPLEIATDYRRYLDGMPRTDGVRNFLASRGITLPEGSPTDAPGTETVAGIGNLKNKHFQETLLREGVEVYPDAAAFLKAMQRGYRIAVISASKNCQAILAAAGLEAFFEVRVDGVVAEALKLRGKPQPDVFLEAARRLGIAPKQAAVFEDAQAGVAAGKAGGFALVVGIDRTNQAEELLANGADLVLQEFPTQQDMMNTSTKQVQRHDGKTLSSALNKVQELLQGKTPAVFLDYDGCLSPIVKDPAKAFMSEPMRQTLQKLASRCPVAVVSGRDRADVAKLVQLDNLYFAGSHGFDISGPNNMHTEPGGAAAAVPALDQAQQELNERLRDVPGVLVERKRYAIAVHYRNVPEEQVSKVLDVTHEVLAKHEALKPGPGKMVLELKPNLDWHKGKAVHWLLQELHLNKPGIIPLYIGDDLTDEDAFAALQGEGIGILVGEHDEETAATYRLENVEEVQAFLEALSEQVKH
ncbi:trehalose-phosphatase [Pontibacter mangrovi]|uniref:trehalose-phosphatase n=1 Tax=Pontibacter mangrovi TaxID=2589816 RepID=UPI0015E2D59A|nr:trehalose-phosphatase [Pontibacter mangrovi]